MPTMDDIGTLDLALEANSVLASISPESSLSAAQDDTVLYVGMTTEEWDCALPS